MTRAWITGLVLMAGAPLQVKHPSACDHAAPPAGMRWECASANSCDCHLAALKAEERNDDDEFNTSPASSRGASIAARIAFFAIPAYPDVARQGQKQGMVSATLVLTREGRVSEVRMLSGDPGLAGAARTAWQQWRFTPGNREESIPVSMKFVLVKDGTVSVSGSSLLNAVVKARAGQ